MDILITSTLREIKNSLGRYLAILTIIALGVGLFAGLRICRPMLVDSADEYFTQQNFYDYRIVSTIGFSQDNVFNLAEQELVKVAEGGCYEDVLVDIDGNDQVFEYYRYNDERMDAIKDCNKDDYKTYKNEKFDSSVASAYGFSFDKIYVIGTVNTASASELIINSLRGIDKTVKLVGQTTNGKNVGMEVMSFGPVDGYSYVFAPISFQSYNAKGESNYANGFTPDIDASTYVDNRFQWGVIYEPSDQEGYIIPDMLYFALNDIFPSTSASLHSLKLAEPTRSSLDTRKISLPRELVNPLRNNMIKPLDETMAE